jgi:hypothetical protein
MTIDHAFLILPLLPPKNTEPAQPGSTISPHSIVPFDPDGDHAVRNNFIERNCCVNRQETKKLYRLFEGIKKTRGGESDTPGEG